MRLSVVIPVYNEEKTVEEVLNRVSRVELGDSGIEKEIIVVNDGSTDGTTEVLSRWRDKIDVVTHEKNRGKGASIRSALLKASGDIVLIQDADLEYDPRDYSRLLWPVFSGKADIVYGSRFTGSQAHRVLFFWHYQANRLISFLVGLFGNLNLTDVETCYKVFKKPVLDSIRLEENDFGFEVEVTLKLAKKKFRFYEVGIAYYGRDYSEGKKIRWTDGVKAVFLILKYGLLGR